MAPLALAARRLAPFELQSLAAARAQLWWSGPPAGAGRALRGGSGFPRRSDAAFPVRALASGAADGGAGKERASSACRHAEQVLLGSARALEQVAAALGGGFEAAVELVEAMPPSARVVVSGVGKSGHIAQKLAASLSSTGVDLPGSSPCLL